MEISVIDSISTPKKHNPVKIKITHRDIVGDLKRAVINHLNLTVCESRLGLYYYTTNKKRSYEINLTNDSMPLINFEGFKDGITLYAKVLDLQIGYRVTYAIGYLGPLIIFFVYFFWNGRANTTGAQFLILSMSTFHYVKRIFESIYVHIFSRGTMSFSHLFRILGYYWILYGIICGWFIFREDKYEKHRLHAYYKSIFILLFFIAEFENLKCHLLLRNIKLKNTGAKGIPCGDLFDYVSCAHYFWELVAWLCFSLFVGHFSCFVFTGFGFLIMGKAAIARHKDYQLKFGDHYPKSRRALIPYLV